MSNVIQHPAIQPQGWETPKTPDEILSDWVSAKAKLVEAALVEMDLRKAVIKSRPFPEGAKEGTQTIELAHGWKLKAVLKQNYKLDKDKTDSVLDDWEAAAPNDEERGRRKLLTERLVKWSPDLSISEYRKLTTEEKAMLTPILTISDGAPTLELVDPDEKKKTR